MPSPYRRDVARLKAEVVARVGAGETTQAVGAAAGMPSRQTLRQWVRARPEFAAAVAWACHHREDWYHDQIQLIADMATPETREDARRQMGPLLRQLVRLRHRPGAVHRRRETG